MRRLLPRLLQARLSVMNQLKGSFPVNLSFSWSAALQARRVESGCGCGADAAQHAERARRRMRNGRGAGCGTDAAPDAERTRNGHGMAC